MIHSFSTFILQYDLRITPGTDLGGLLLFLAIVAGLIIVAVITNRIVQLFGNQSSPNNKYNRFLFMRVGRDVGLDKQHIEYLERLIRSLKVKYPSLIFTNPQLLDAVLKRGIASVERQPGLLDRERVTKLNLIWEIKQLIENNSKKGIGLRSTFLVKPGQTMILTAYNGERYHSKLISNHTNGLTVTMPVISVEKEHLFKKGNRLKVFFWRENDSGYSFITRVIETDRANLHILHSRKIKREQHRKYSRKPLKKSCFLYPAEIVEETRRNGHEKKIVIHDNMRHMGIISDISVGGCSISSTRAYKKGAYMKLEFDLRISSPIVAYGKVQSVFRRASGTTGMMMHIQFIKLSGSARNEIYSYIYNYV